MSKCRAAGVVLGLSFLSVGCAGIVDLGPERTPAAQETRNDTCSRDGEGVVWAQQFGDASYQVVSSVSAGGGAVYIAGNFAGAVDFGGGPLISAGFEDYFVAGFDTKGNHLWSKRFGDATDQTKTLVRVRAVPGGGVVFFGEHSGTIELDPGDIHSASGLGDGFVARYDRSGTLLWRKVIASPGSDAVTDVAFDPTSGELAVAARFEGTVLDFAGAPVEHHGSSDILLSKLGPGGDPIWSHAFGGGASDRAEGVAIDAQGRVAMAGAVDGPVDFGGGATPTNQAPDAFVAVYGPAGDHLWSKVYPGPGFQAVNRLAVHRPTGELILAGGLSVNGTVDFGGGTLSADKGAFLARLTRDGTYVASRSIENFFVPRALDVDAQGNVLISGPFTGITDFGGGPIASAGKQDGMVGKFSPALDPLWTLQVGSIEDDNTFGVSSDGASGVFVGAYFQAQIELAGCGPLSSRGGTDALLVKLDR